MKRSLLLLLLALTVHAAAQPVKVSFCDGMTRISRSGTSPTAQTHTLHAARGEWEPLQIIVTATPEQLKNVELLATGIAKNDSDALLPAPNVFREHYVRVSTSTPMAPLPPGDYPDALVPLDMPAQELGGTSVVNQPYWVDVFVPYTAAPGAYTGEVRFKFADGTSAIASYTLNVWDFDLPVVPKLRTSIMTTVRHVAEVHGLEYKDNTPSLTHMGLLNAYYDLLAEHRLSVDQIYGSYPEADTGKIDEDKVERALRKHLLHRHCSTVGLPIWPKWPFNDPLGQDREAAMNYVAQWMKLLAKIHCESRGYVIMGDLDEPNDAAAYEVVRRWGEFFNEVEKKHGIRVPLHVTEQPTPEKPAWGSLNGAVDIWVPHFSEVWKDMEWAGGSHDIALRRQAGDEVWAYAALVQIPDAWEQQNGMPKKLAHGFPPVWALDYPPMSHRVVGWLFPKVGITGFDYWDTIFAAEGVDVWKDASTFKTPDGATYNGDGSFIYPATEKHQGRHAPVASMRLKWLRETAEDYDYLMLARQLGLEDDARRLTSSFARGFGDWDDNTDALMEARHQLGTLIESAEHRKQTAALQKGGTP
ncbi:DUF4091 domain-containing protein [Prosthecobacter sp.]|uniref:DUF4091 domain-containing protein n=1 Tax=Prosthecobacter sp. TaxID=1965333 RepID=UPI001DBE38C0|nr:DUF4091 domain-containing protein [Prosthecobacter sp.]MCB1278781.1 DUF4091 domain-containing protein [Prosthecobacter sp.]